MAMDFSDKLRKCVPGGSKFHSHVIQEITLVPEIGIEGNDLQFRVRRMIDAVSSIVHARFVGGGGADPIVLLPKCGDMVPIPRPVEPKSA